MIGRFKAFATAFALLLVGCGGGSDSATAGGNKTAAIAPLLASDLMYNSEGGNDHYSIEVSPRLCKFPSIVNSIKAHIIKDWNFVADASKPNDPEVEDTWNWAKVETSKADGRLLSFRAFSYSYYYSSNGNFQYHNVESHFFDTQDSKFIKISDVFYDWPAARLIIQKRLCLKVSGRGMCPDVDKLPIIFTSSVAKYDQYSIDTDWMVFGYHAAGAIREEFEIDDQLYKLINPRYRDDFEIYSPCC
jgi:hypothetical protein